MPKKMRNRAGNRNDRAVRRAAECAFTLLELMAVMTILLVLIALGIVRYEQAIVRAREAALKQDLDEVNQAIQEYTRDKEMPPNSLDDLVQGQYLGKLPVDPMTKASDWVTDNCDVLDSTDQLSTGICTVHSASNQVSPFTNTPYSSW